MGKKFFIASIGFLMAAAIAWVIYSRTIVPPSAHPAPPEPAAAPITAPPLPEPSPESASAENAKDSAAPVTEAPADQSASAPQETAATTPQAPPATLKLDTATMEDTVWESVLENGVLVAQFLKDGQLMATHPLLSQYLDDSVLRGSWRIEDNILITEVTTGDETQKTEFHVEGDTLVADENVLRRIK